MAIRDDIISRNINGLLSDRGMGKKELAERASISRPQLQRYFAGTNHWPMAKLEAIAKALEVPMVRIIGEEKSADTLRFEVIRLALDAGEGNLRLALRGLTQSIKTADKKEHGAG